MKWNKHIFFIQFKEKLPQTKWIEHSVNSLSVVLPVVVSCTVKCKNNSNILEHRLNIKLRAPCYQTLTCIVTFHSYQKVIVNNYTFYVDH